MDAKVWQKFPDELLPLVLARLPWWKNLELRGVCKSWDRLLSDRRFLASLSPISTSRPPCVVLIRPEDCAIVNFAISRWALLPAFVFLPSFRTADGFHIAAAAAGLFLMDGLLESRMILVNPLSKIRRQVPPVPPLEGLPPSVRSPNYYLRMVGTAKPNNVKIVIVQIESSRIDVLWTIFVYDLLKDSWDLVTKDLQRQVGHSLKDAIFLADDLYLLTKQQGRFGPRIRFHSVIKVMATNVVKVPTDFNINVPTVHLFQHDGCLMLVCGAEEWKLSIDIWRLENRTQRWEKVVSMPEHLLTRFCAKLHTGFFKFHAEGNFACFSRCPNSEIVIVCSLVDHVWWQISCKDYLSREYLDEALNSLHDAYFWQPNFSILCDV